ncbi:MAG: hypothetical protein WKG52_13115 [Variovorax sp.]
MALRDLALTVLELEPDEFHWILMEAVQADSEECLVYKPVDSSTQGLPDYSEALIEGASALRVLQGLAPFGKPIVQVGIAEDAAAAGSAKPKLKPKHREATDSCMFTTGSQVL